MFTDRLFFNFTLVYKVFLLSCLKICKNIFELQFKNHVFWILEIPTYTYSKLLVTYIVCYFLTNRISNWFSIYKTTAPMTKAISSKQSKYLLTQKNIYLLLVTARSRVLPVTFTRGCVTSNHFILLWSNNIKYFIFFLFIRLPVSRIE